MSSTNPLDHGAHHMQTSMSPSQLTIPSDHQHQPSYAMSSPQTYHQPNPFSPFAPPPQMMSMPSPMTSRKRTLPDDSGQMGMQMPMPAGSADQSIYAKQSPMMRAFDMESAMAAQATPSQMQMAPAPTQPPPAKKTRVNTPWTAAEEHLLKQLREKGQSWGEIAKSFPVRTEGSVKKHWYKDMHYADFAEDESAALLQAIREYEMNKWKVIGNKVNKPAKACEQYAKEHFTKEQIAGKAKDKFSAAPEGGQ